MRLNGLRLQVVKSTNLKSRYHRVDKNPLDQYGSFQEDYPFQGLLVTVKQSLLNWVEFLVLL